MPIPRKVDPPEGSISQRLDLLFRHAHPDNRGPYSAEEVATALTNQGHKVGISYIYQLRNGQKNNPTADRLQALAHFFHVPVSYFFERQSTGDVIAALELAQVMRKHDLKIPAVRVLDELSVEQRKIQAARWERIAALVSAAPVLQDGLHEPLAVPVEGDV